MATGITCHYLADRHPWPKLSRLAIAQLSSMPLLTNTEPACQPLYQPAFDQQQSLPTAIALTIAIYHNMII